MYRAYIRTVVPPLWRHLLAGLARRLAHVANAHHARDWLAAWPFAAALVSSLVVGVALGAALL